MSGHEDADATARRYRAPFSSNHPIPTVQRYKKEKQEKEATYGGVEEEQEASRTQRARDAYDRYKHGDEAQRDDEGPYKSENKNLQATATPDGEGDKEITTLDQSKEQPIEEAAKDTSEADISQDPKEQRKQMKKRKGDAAREVTDPVTHLPVRIHDFTERDLKNTPENEPNPGLRSRTGTEQMENPEDDPQIKADDAFQRDAHSAMDVVFPPPNFEEVKKQLSRVFEQAIIAGIGTLSIFAIGISLLGHFSGFDKSGTYISILTVIGGLVSAITVWVLHQWAKNKINDVWENETWESERQAGKRIAAKNQIAESTHWLNSFLASVWPLINPDLFVAIQDQLEDVMQASLPKMVRMVSVEDLGQGSESLRILGIKWLPSGAAAQSVGEDGSIQKKKKSNGESDRKVPGEGEVEQNSDQEKKKSSDGGGDGQPDHDEGQENIAEGMEAEEGEFINLEVALSYRARGAGKGLRSRAKNAHLYMAFYLIGGVKFPVWVEMHGFVGVLRLRMQLTPDPPFVSLCTLTFLGQPKVDLSCVPLSKHALNIMDLPLISNFVQSAVDAGLSTLVAPRNMTLDLKDMLVGDDFKKDTTARGVLMVTVKRGFDFKEGDSGIGPLKSGSSDPYVSVGWAKFSKPVWSTRVLMGEMEPYWQETAFILVTPEELNVDERLRLQLWDSDRTSADDDLGRIELDLKHIMRNENSNGKLWDRQDGFRSIKKAESMPGQIEWSVGYFSKLRMQESQLASQTKEPGVKNMEDLRKLVEQESERKLREAKKDETEEIEQQKAQDLKEREDELITHAPPPDGYPTGILSIQIHNITGLELQAINKREQSKKDNNSEVDEEGDDLPSAYCTIILNHQKIYKTRTKPKNSKPFFNAGCERLVRDWRNTEIHLSIRDARVHENDALLGIVHLPLSKLFEKRSQFSEFFPLSGGVGYGKVRVSMVFRAVKLQAPRELLGWDFGTVEIQPSVHAGEGLPQDLHDKRIKLHTNIGKAKLTALGDGTWSSSPKSSSSSSSPRTLKLAVRRRYSSPLILEFRDSSLLRDSTLAFAVLWLKDLPDNDTVTLTLPVWKGDLARASQNTLSDCGQRHGSIVVSLTFWSGLSGYHARFAGKDGNMADVMEVLDCAADVASDDNALNFTDDDAGTSSSSSSSSDSSSSDDDEDTPTGSEKSTNDNSNDDGSRGIIDSVRDYKHNAKQLHRKNRGLMQWKGPRTAAWLKGKAKRTEKGLAGLFSHHDGGREAGIETEV
ncbi:hypothetical protein EJ05DRAFT_463888 [Pseudovirgaria hyperparasitica]|uniref:Meiotically up-regulated gene 190 protein n=1 Tax=Pseudovirgaria hyperparasitica TaxID=470096 RepID=A0A6A6WB67_9PEZI|nr:uncharacterized protein EJ05DRAFT_463888 [Pseudovirgaria hyperparasitica]KAF2759284.1 hypothetical protein EJ05DRAFT_463888 [Pseudovirgaria hyperparasitica]